MLSPPPLSDSTCIRKCLAGDTEAFGDLVARYQTPLIAFARGRLPHAAEEVAQESFVRAFTHLHTLQKPASLFPWLIGIAERVIWESKRTTARQQTAMARLAAEQSTNHEPDTRADDLELDRVVANLAEPYRQIVLLRYYSQLSCAEIAQRLNLPVGAVTKRLSRAYAMLRETLVPETAATERTCHEMH